MEPSQKPSATLYRKLLLALLLALGLRLGHRSFGGSFRGGFGGSFRAGGEFVAHFRRRSGFGRRSNRLFELFLADLVTGEGDRLELVAFAGEHGDRTVHDLVFVAKQRVLEDVIQGAADAFEHNRLLAGAARAGAHALRFSRLRLVAGQQVEQLFLVRFARGVSQALGAQGAVRAAFGRTGRDADEGVRHDAFQELSVDLGDLLISDVATVADDGFLDFGEVVLGHMRWCLCGVLFCVARHALLYYTTKISFFNRFLLLFEISGKH